MPDIQDRLAEQLRLYFSTDVRFKLLRVTTPGESAVMVAGAVISMRDKKEASVYAAETCHPSASLRNLIHVAIRAFVVRHLLIDALLSVAVAQILNRIEAGNRYVEIAHVVAGFTCFVLLLSYGVYEVVHTIREDRK